MATLQFISSVSVDILEDIVIPLIFIPKLRIDCFYIDFRMSIQKIVESLAELVQFF